MKSITRATALLTAFFAPALAVAAVTYTQDTGYTFGFVSSSGGYGFGGPFGGCSSQICGVASTILNLINNVAVPLLFAISFIVFLYGIAQAYIFSKGDVAKVEAGHKLLLYGLIGFVVMISLWGLVNVVSNTFGLSGASAPVLPVSYPI